MHDPLTWSRYAARYVLREKSSFFRKRMRYCNRRMMDEDAASDRIRRMLETDRPFLVGRMGLFETAVMRMYRFRIRKKYALVMNNLYNCAGFFPNDTELGGRFLEISEDALRQTDLFASNRQFLEDFFINRNLPETSVVTGSFRLFEPYSLRRSWTEGLAGKKVLVVSPFDESIRSQYARREQIYPGTQILPEFTLLTYRPLLTVGDLKDERFADWFEALDFMKKEILELDFDVALLGCGAYGFPLGAEIKKSGRQAVCMGGVLQILFGVLGRRWDGSRFGGIEHMDENLKKYYSDAWIYPLEERPKAADRVEYGPYWK